MGINVVAICGASITETAAGLIGTITLLADGLGSAVRGPSWCCSWASKVWHCRRLRAHTADTIDDQPYPLTPPDQLNVVFSGDLLNRLTPTDRFHGDTGLELAAVDATLVHRMEPL